MKKIFSIILLLVTFAFVQGCVKNETKPLIDEVDDYRASILVIEDANERGEIVGAVLEEENVGYLSYVWNYDDIFNDQTYFFTCTDYEGKILSRFEITEDVKKPYAFCTLGEDKVLIAGYSDDLRKVVDVYDKSGNLLNTIDTGLDYMAEDATKLYPLSDKTFLIKSNKTASICDIEKEVLVTGSVPKDSKIFSSKNCGFHILYKENDKDYIAKLCLDDLSVSDEAECSLSYDDYDVSSGIKEYPLTYNDNDFLYGYSLDGNLNKIMNHYDVGFWNGSGEDWTEFDDGRLCQYSRVIVRGDIGGVDIFTYIKRETPRKTITVGLPFSSSAIMGSALGYNENNEEYRIRVIDRDYSSEDEDNEESVTDFIKKNHVDIIALNDRDEIKELAKSGLIVSLDPFIEADKEINLEDYFENIISTGRYKKKLYAIPGEAALDTMVMRKSDAEGLIGWNVADFEKYVSSQSDGYKTLYGYGRRSLLNFLLDIRSDEFFKGKKCNFDTQCFYDVLEETKKYSFFDYFQGGYDEQVDAFSINGATIDSPSWAFNLSEYNYEKNVVFKEPISLVGVPSSTGGGNILHAWPYIAICKDSGNEDAAWQFVRYFLSDDYYDIWCRGRIPAKISAYYRQADEMEEYEWWIHGEFVNVNPPTKEDVNEFYNYIIEAKPLEKESPVDDEMFEIIYEEATPFFKGKETVEEVAAVIQEKVSGYLKNKK